MKLFSLPSIEEVAIVVIALLAFWIPQQFDADPSTAPPPTATTTAITPTVSPSTAITPGDRVPTPTASNPDKCDFRDETERVRGATVLIYAYGADGSWGAGTGFHIGNGHYVTAAHVIQDELGNRVPNIQILSAKTGTTEVATVVAEGVFDPDSNRQSRDIAKLHSILTLEDELAWRPPLDTDIDRDVRAIGYPWSQEKGDTVEIPEALITRGTLLSVVTQDGIEIVQSSVQIQSGNSGGPLLDECGTAIAVLSYTSHWDREDRGVVDKGYPVFISMTELSQVQ